MESMEIDRERVSVYGRGHVDVADRAGVGLVGGDVDAAVGVPKADCTVLAGAEAVITVGVETRRQNRPFVPFQSVHFPPLTAHHFR